MKQVVSILGCGWLGFSLAQELIAKGFKVKGSTTQEEKLESLKNQKIEGYKIELPSDNFEEEFFNTDYLVINTPPQSRKEGVDYHLNAIKSILSLIKNDTKIIYISSTSVYPDVNETISEHYALNHEADRARAIIQVEHLLKEKFNKNLLILRSGGLLGYDRVPGKYFSGKEVAQYQPKVNYIHRDDAIEIIIRLIQKNSFGETFNLVAPKHPTRKEVYLNNAEKFNFEKPIFKLVEQNNIERKIDGSKIVKFLDYSFIYPDPLKFYYTY